MKYSIKALFILMFILIGYANGIGEEHSTNTPVKKVLFIGDSMTGWLSERMGAFGNENDFKVATVVWDGSTIKKWANTSNLKNIISKQAPDVVFISLGMNELFERNPDSQILPYIKKLLNAIGDKPYVWIGPPTWPGKNQATISDWLKNNVNNYFESNKLSLSRQSKSNPHPTKAACAQWMDSVVKWLPIGTDINLNGLKTPATGAMKRGETFIYKKMTETL
jgi:lysophospholipase L1-like esterase